MHLEQSSKDKLAFVQFQTELTLEKALWQGGSQLATLRREHLPSLKLALNNLLRDLAGSLNVKETIEPHQAVEIIETIISEYWMLKIEEIAFAFKYAKMGRYGKDFNRLDILTVCTWLDKYLDSDERWRLIETQGDKYKQVSQAPMSEQEKKVMYAVNEVAEKKKFVDGPVVVASLSDAQWKERLFEIIPMASDEDLGEWRKDYLKHGFDVGVEAIDNEILNRKY